MADAYIKYNDHSISSAFKDHYIVPDYQREYVWRDEQIEQLTSDLIEAYNADNKKAYFLGTIVTYDAGSQFELIEQGQEKPKGLTQSGELLYNANKDQTQNRAKNKSSQTALLSHS